MISGSVTPHHQPTTAIQWGEAKTCRPAPLALRSQPGSSSKPIGLVRNPLTRMFRVPTPLPRDPRGTTLRQRKPTPSAPTLGAPHPPPKWKPPPPAAIIRDRSRGRAEHLDRTRLGSRGICRDACHAGNSFNWPFKATKWGCDGVLPCSKAG